MAVKELSAVVAVAADEMEFSVLLRLRRGACTAFVGGRCPPASSNRTAADLDSWEDVTHGKGKGSALFELLLVALAAAIPLWT